jgi:uncharacterized protein with GYD domain
MPKFLTQSVYTPETLKGLIKEGGVARRESLRQSVEAMGGKLEAFYWAFGATDLFMIIELPDNVTAAATSLIANASGASKFSLTVLLTPEEMEQATQVAQRMAAVYHPPKP